MGKTNVEQLNIEINLITAKVHQEMKSLSKSTTDYTKLVENAQGAIQSLMDRTGMSASSAMAQIKLLNTEMIALVKDRAKYALPSPGINPINPTLLNAVLRDAENIRKSTLAVMNSEVVAENKLLSIEMQRNLALQSIEQRARASQARAKVSGMFTGEDILGDIVGKAQQEKLKSSQLRGMLFAPRDVDAATAKINAMNNSLNQTDSSSRKAAKGLSTLNIVMGIMVSMAVHEAFRLISAAIIKIIDSASQLEQSFIRLGIAERSLSQAGVDITPKELADIAKEVVNTYKTISEIDALKMISNLAVLTKDLKLSAKEYKTLSLAIPLVAQQAGVTIENATDQVITGLTKSGRGWADLGITVNKTIIQQEAVRLGLVKNAEAFKALTAEQKQQIEVKALINILDKNTAGNLKDQAKYLDSLAGKQAGVARAWEQLATALGVLSTPAIKAGLDAVVASLENILRITNGLSQSTDALDRFNASLTELTGVEFKSGGNFFQNLLDAIFPLETVLAELGGIMTPFFATLATGVKFLSDLLSGKGFIQSFENAGENFGNALIMGFSQALAVGLAGENGTIATWVKDQWKKATGVDLNTFGTAKSVIDESKLPADTPTGVPDVIDEAAASDKINEAFDKLKDDIEKANRKLANEKFDAKINLDLKIEDININYQQKVEDIARKHAQKIQDINRDYADNVRDIKTDAKQKEAESTAKYNLDEVKAEKDKNEELLRLKEDYLMNLEDALHERDARQILKLMRSYALDKDRINREAASEAENRKAQFEIDKKSRQDETSQKLKDAATERSRKLAEANLDRQRELEAAAIDRQRSIEDANRDYQRKLEELQRQHQRELQELGYALKAQYDLTAQQAAALRAMLAGNLNAYSQYISSLVAATAQANSTLTGLVQAPNPLAANSLSTPIPNSSSIPTSPPIPTTLGGGGHKKAEGGTMIANRPTTVTFGEAGMEMASFMPMGRVGKDVNSLSSNVSSDGSGGVGGKVSIELLLSPDLESRIVSNTLNKTADVIMRTQRSRG